MAWNVRDWFREDIQHEDAEHVELWKAWFTRHGINADEVLLTHWVERRAHEDPRTGDKQYQIVWLEDGVRDEGDGNGSQPITVHREIDLNEPPAPFPVP